MTQFRENNFIDPRAFDISDWEFIGERGLLQEIVENAQAAIGCRMVLLHRYDFVRQVEVPVAGFTPASKLQVQVESLFRRITKNRDWAKPAKEFPILDTAFWRELQQNNKLEGNIYKMSALHQEYSVLNVTAGWVFGFRYTSLYNLMVRVRGQPQAVARLTVVFTRTPNAQKRRTAEAFARQVSLTLENAFLSVQLGRKVLELEHSQAQMMQAEERIKQEIAEILHSRVQMRLLVLWHKLGDLEDQLTQKHQASLLSGLRAELDLIRENDVRAASHALHPSVIALGLSAAAFSLADEYSSKLDVRVDVSSEFEVFDRNLGLSSDLRLMAYRVLEETLGNSLKHASASQVIVKLELGEQEMKLSISDNGQGFDISNVQPGLGFSAIEARVSIMKGKWTLETSSQGTTLKAIFPILSSAVLTN